jgi:Na+-transporting methylmalonyl-CoA/oxaloacetate decarboxylase gamma subunit
MKLFTSHLLKPILVAVCGVAVVIAVTTLLIDYLQSASTAEERTHKLVTVEAAARANAEATPEFESEVDRQTSASLARALRQRTAGIALALAGGLGLALLKWRRETSVVVPQTRCQQGNVSVIRTHGAREVTPSLCHREVP